MTQETPACSICGHEVSRIFDKRQYLGHPVTNVECLRCGFVYQSPRMTENDLDEFYEKEYRQLYQGSEGPSSKDLGVQSQRAEALLQMVQPHLQRITSHLDIGCSAGLFLKGFQAHYACQAAGIEPGNAYRQHAQAQGLVVYASLEELQAAHQEKFDLVSMMHVLEHLPDPVGYLSRLREELLQLGGYLLIEVPNLYCHDSFELAHLASYSPHSLRQALRLAGYEVVWLKEHGQPRSARLPLYLTALAKPASAPAERQIDHEHQVALKRSLGILRRKLISRLAPRQAWLPAA